MTSEYRSLCILLSKIILSLSLHYCRMNLLIVAYFYEQ